MSKGFKVTSCQSNFEALWPTDFILAALKDLNLLKKHFKKQEAGSILKVDFAISKSPHLHRSGFLPGSSLVPPGSLPGSFWTNYKQAAKILWQSLLPYVSIKRSVSRFFADGLKWVPHLLATYSPSKHSCPLKIVATTFQIYEVQSWKIVA